MEKGIPLKLMKEPLLEVVWEIRFNSTKPSIADLLPGLLFKTLSYKYPNLVRLPAADIPAILVENDLSMRYVPKIRLECKNRAVQIGEHVISLNCRRPYIGWKEFSKDIKEVINAVRGTNLIGQLERFSIKYIDLINLKQPPEIDCLKIELKLGGQRIDKQPMILRTEIKENDMIHIIHIVSPAEVGIPEEPDRLTGVLLDIDTINIMNENDMNENAQWDIIESRLDKVHQASKNIFFNLLTDETIQNFDPKYQE